MDRGDAWKLVAGIVTLGVLVGLLLSTPSVLLAKSLTFVDTELTQRGENPQRVLTKVDIGDPSQFKYIPTRMGNWSMSDVHEYDAVEAILDTKVLLSRDYRTPDLDQPVNLLIIQSSNVTSFHPAAVCYRAQGWDVPDDGGDVVTVPILNASFAKQAWLSKDERNIFDGNMSAKLLEAKKQDGNASAKRIALYVYLKREDWTVTRQITWLRIEIEVPYDTPAELAEPYLKSLMGETVPHLFGFEQTDEATLAEAIVTHYGSAGVAGIAVVFAVPGGWLAVTGVQIARGRKDEAEP